MHQIRQTIYVSSGITNQTAWSGQNITIDLTPYGFDAVPQYQLSGTYACSARVLSISKTSMVVEVVCTYQTAITTSFSFILTEYYS